MNAKKLIAHVCEASDDDDWTTASWSPYPDLVYKFKYSYDPHTGEVRYMDTRHGSAGLKNRRVNDPTLKAEVIKSYKDGRTDDDGYVYWKR